MECGPAHSDGDKGCEVVGVVAVGGPGVKKKRERERGVGKKAERKSQIHWLHSSPFSMTLLSKPRLQRK